MDTSDDHKLLQYDTYDEYLNALVTKDDIRFMRSTDYGRKIAALGYRSTTETLSQIQFTIRKEVIREALYPTRKLHSLVSDGCSSSDVFLQELAFRERSNRLFILSTIIFLRHHTKTGYEISAYIDYEDSLRRSRLQQDGAVDWYAIFHENKRLWPHPNDMSYYHWRSGASYTNDTKNFKVITDPIKGLIFMSRHDRKRLTVDPSLDTPGSNSTRTIIFSDRYDHVVLYDHIIRAKI